MSNWETPAPSVSPGLQPTFSDDDARTQFPQNPFQPKAAEQFLPQKVQKMKEDKKQYPHLMEALSDAPAGNPEREDEREANFEKLSLETPDEFGRKYFGQIKNMAEEHGIGDLLGYSFRSAKIEVFGTEGVLVLDYDLKPVSIRDMFPFDSVAPETMGEDGLEGDEEFDLEEDNTEL